MTKDIVQDLSTWDHLNKAIMQADADYCVVLLKAELKGKRRQQFMLRIHSRLNKLRADAERRELMTAHQISGSKVHWVEKWR